MEQQASQPTVRTCTYVWPDGRRCGCIVHYNKCGGRCVEHVNRSTRTKCIYPGCEKWTTSVHSKCSSHPAIRPDVKPVQYVPSVVAAPPVTLVSQLQAVQPPVTIPAVIPSLTATATTPRCNYVYEDGVHCILAVAEGRGRCHRHLSSPIPRTPPSLAATPPGVHSSAAPLFNGAFGNRKFKQMGGKCGNDKMAKLATAPTMYLLQEMYSSTGYIPKHSKIMVATKMVPTETKTAALTTAVSATPQRDQPSGRFAEPDLTADSDLSYSSCESGDSTNSSPATTPIKVPTYPTVPPVKLPPITLF